MIIGRDINFAADLLKSGKVVAIPTETVYGLAANAYDPDAVIKIFEIKNRPKFNPLIVHIHNWEMLDEIANNVPPILKTIAQNLWPGPLTILIEKTDRIHPLVTAGSNFVAVRIPDHPVALELLARTGFPLAAPSANLFGKISPTSAAHVESQLHEKLDYILDGGECKVGIESTIIKVNNTGRVEILRPGGITADQLKAFTGYLPEAADPADLPEAPGMLKSHYAPRIPLIIGDIDALLLKNKDKKIALISFFKDFGGKTVLKKIILSKKMDLHEAARNLFSALHEAEISGAELIISEYFPEAGIGIAINDRLKRASS